MEVKRGSKVEIVSIPWHFSAFGYELLDQLFVPLLSTAQRANDLLGIRVRGESSALQAAMYMGGELLCDASFLPIRPRDEISSSNLYRIDFVQDIFEVSTITFSSVQNKEALFTVVIKGRIRGDKFQVLDAATGTTLFSFSRFEAEKPNFFTREFPFVAYESRRDPALFGAGTNDHLVEDAISMTLSIPVAGGSARVLVEKKNGDVHAEVMTPGTTASFMRLPLSTLNSIPKTVNAIEEFFKAHPDHTAITSVLPAESEGNRVGPSET